MVQYSLTVYCENKPGVLARIVNLLRKRNINIEMLHVDTKKGTKRVHRTLGVRIDMEAGFEDDHQAETVAHQLERLINVLEVKKAYA